VKPIGSHYARIALKGFTLIELLVAICILSIMASLLFPVYMSAANNASNATCLNNVRELGIAIDMYKDDYDEVYPWACNHLSHLDSALSPWPATTISTMPEYQLIIRPYVKSLHTFQCPLDTGIRPYTGGATEPRNTFEAWGTSYKFDEYISADSAHDVDSDPIGLSGIFLLMDNSFDWHIDYPPPAIVDAAYCNIVYADLHACRGNGEWVFLPNDGK
jgi:prepilin-type N-terminal cleavage/methylation domain-containing protein